MLSSFSKKRGPRLHTHELLELRLCFVERCQHPFELSSMVLVSPPHPSRTLNPMWPIRSPTPANALMEESGLSPIGNAETA